MYVEERNCLCYKELNSDPDVLYKVWYYSMRLKTMAWINGWACDRSEMVETNAQVNDFGLEPAGCVKMVQGLIDNVREGRSNERRSPLRPLFP
jgi:hypothetical protein